MRLLGLEVEISCPVGNFDEAIPPVERQRCAHGNPWIFVSIFFLVKKVPHGTSILSWMVYFIRKSNGNLQLSAKSKEISESTESEELWLLFSHGRITTRFPCCSMVLVYLPTKLGQFLGKC